MLNIEEKGVCFKQLSSGHRFRAGGNLKDVLVSVDVKFKGSADHMTIMPVVCPSFENYTPLVVLPRKRDPWYKVDGSTVTIAEFIMPNALVFRREGRARADKLIFEKWTTRFLEETEVLRR